MFKKSFKALMTGIFAFSMLSTSIMCNADTTTTAINTSKVVTSATSSNVTTTSLGATTTAPVTSTTQNTTTTTPIATTTTPVTTTTAPVTTTSVAVTGTSYMGQETEYIFEAIDQILYDDTLTSATKSNKISTYIRQKVLSHEVPTNVALDLIKDAKANLDSQDNDDKMYQSINDSLDSYIKSVTYQNSSSIETYCSDLIKDSFKQGVFSASETIRLLKELHSKISSKIADDYNLTLATQEITNEYDSYQFTNAQSIINQLSYSYGDLKGWIYVPNANISYPIMYYYDDNDYYLQHDMNGFGSSQGCIELDYRCDFSDTIEDTLDYTNNQLIYGHNLHDGTMFSNLANYKDPNYWADNKLIEISTLDDTRLYEIYACCSIYGLGDGTAFNYWNAKYLNMDYDLFQEYMYLTQETMLYETGNFPTFGQDIITLQTCDDVGDWRIVIFAKRIK